MKRILTVAMLAVMLCGIWILSDSESVKAFVQEVELTSPRLTALSKEVETGNRGALESFWQDVTKQGAPMIEPLKGDDRHVLLTFLWRAKDAIKNVVVIGGVAGMDIDRNQMARLLDTDLWYKTYKVRNDARFSYNLSPNDSLVPFGKIDFKDQKAELNISQIYFQPPLSPSTRFRLPAISAIQV